SGKASRGSTATRSWSRCCSSSGPSRAPRRTCPRSTRRSTTCWACCAEPTGDRTMSSRVTTQTEVDRSLAFLRTQADQLSRLQEQAGSGTRLNQPSDGPVDVVVVMSATAQDQRFDAYLANIADARSVLNDSVSTLTDAGQV